MDEPVSSNEDFGNQWWSGLQVSSQWSSDEWVLHWQPNTSHLADQRSIFDDAIIENIIWCHCIFAATAAAQLVENLGIGAGPPIRYVPASLRVAYSCPIPIDQPFTIRARIMEIRGGKTRLACSLIAQGVEYARGEVTAVRILPTGN